nr:translocator protein like [Quercus suber]
MDTDLKLPVRSVLTSDIFDHSAFLEHIDSLGHHKLAKMTTYIPSITLPTILFANPYAAILAPVAAGTAIGYATRPKQTQKTYLALRQPPFRPPPWVFGPAWTTLYGLMGFAAYRAWSAGASSIDPRVLTLTKQGATLYSIQLGLNLIWMPLFFGFKRPIEATIDVATLTGVVGYLAYIWGQVDPVAGYALIPYNAWLCFATYLSAGAGHLNGWDFSDKEVPTTAKPGQSKFIDEKKEI